MRWRPINILLVHCHSSTTLRKKLYQYRRNLNWKIDSNQKVVLIVWTLKHVKGRRGWVSLGDLSFFFPAYNFLYCFLSGESIPNIPLKYHAIVICFTQSNYFNSVPPKKISLGLPPSPRMSWFGGPQTHQIHPNYQPFQFSIMANACTFFFIINLDISSSRYFLPSSHLSLLIYLKLFFIQMIFIGTNSFIKNVKNTHGSAEF